MFKHKTHKIVSPEPTGSTSPAATSHLPNAAGASLSKKNAEEVARAMMRASKTGDMETMKFWLEQGATYLWSTRGGEDE